MHKNGWGRIAVFYGLTLAISWSVWLTMIALGIRTGPGSAHSHLPGLLGPLIAALIAIPLFDGGAGLAGFARRLVRVPRCTPMVWIAVIVPPAIAAIVLGYRVLTGAAAVEIAALVTFPGVPAGTSIWLTFAVVLFLNGFGEEAGWRGYLLGPLVHRFGFFSGTLVVAVLWAIWHLPLFWLNTPMMELGIGGTIGWSIGLILGAFVLSHLYFAAGRSILVVALWHTFYNFSVATPATTGITAAVVSSLVMIWGLWAAWRLYRFDRTNAMS